MLSIIICTYNRDKYIYNALKNIAENDFPVDKYEILLINNNSTDNTESECNRFVQDYPQVNFRYFIELKQGLSYARNRGIIESIGDVVVYVDDDAVVNKEYLSAYADIFNKRRDVAAAGGPIIPLYETQEPRWMSHFTKPLITGYKFHGNKIKQFPCNDYPGGGNAAYRKSVFDKIGLFNVELGRKGDSLMGAEEKDIFDKMQALNMQFYYLPKAILYHIISDNKLSKEYFNKLTYSIGQSERLRTLKIGKSKFYKRIFSEIIKWGISIILCLYYTILFSPQKGVKLLSFRWNVTKGLTGR